MKIQTLVLLVFTVACHASLAIDSDDDREHHPYSRNHTYYETITIHEHNTRNSSLDERCPTSDPKTITIGFVSSFKLVHGIGAQIAGAIPLAVETINK